MLKLGGRGAAKARPRKRRCQTAETLTAAITEPPEHNTGRLTVWTPFSDRGAPARAPCHRHATPWSTPVTALAAGNGRPGAQAFILLRHRDRRRAIGRLAE
jgi:hypothetical protein